MEYHDVTFAIDLKHTIDLSSTYIRRTFNLYFVYSIGMIRRARTKYRFIVKSWYVICKLLISKGFGPSDISQLQAIKFDIRQTRCIVSNVQDAVKISTGQN